MKDFRIIPVIDLKYGLVVHGVQGQRESYMPINSCLVNSADPFDIAKAFHELFGLEDLYVADLDAIIDQKLNWNLLRTLKEIIHGSLWVDAGIKDAEDIFPLTNTNSEIILGTETLKSIVSLEEIAKSFDPQKLILSLDFVNGKLLGPKSLFEEIHTPQDIIQRCKENKINKIIVLELSVVGSNRGPQLENLQKIIRQCRNWGNVFAGGGVRSIEDIRKLREIGACGCLIASALHNGSISREQLTAFLQN